MFKNYLTTAIRNLRKNKVHSFINIAGLSAGLAVAMLIGLWMWDELSFDKQTPGYSHVAQVIQNVENNGTKSTWFNVPFPLADELRTHYGSDFKYVVNSSGTGSHILAVGEKSLDEDGAFMEQQAPNLLGLHMLNGPMDGLKEPGSILISQSVAAAYFGNADPINKIIKIDNRQDVKVTGVYSDLPNNSSFYGLSFIAPWKLIYEGEGLSKWDNPWRANAFQLYVQLADNATMASVSAKIKDAKLRNVRKDELAHHPQLFLHAMSKWHLYSEYKNGVNAGGAIENVWMFGITGVFVLLLACINFMNLSTARSEKRAKEVGIRKSVGSLRIQLIFQFFSESFLVVFIAFVLSLLLVQLALPFFNQLADKKIALPWNNILFWVAGLVFCTVTGLIAGSYPALYLSSFKPVKVLKGTFKAGRFAAMPRKVLVVLQFTVSVVLITGTIIVFRQVQFAKNRPIGYDRNGLVMFPMDTDDLHKHFEVAKDDLIKSGAVTEVCESRSPVTGVWSTNSGFDWKGKDPGLAVDFPNTEISFGYGKTVGWQFIAGRDFSKAFASDSSAFVINATAAKFMGLKNPVGETVKWDGKPYTIVGVIKDMVVESPYQPVRPHFFHISTDAGNFVLVKISPSVSAAAALAKIEAIFKKYNPSQPFGYQFGDAEYSKKFSSEERVGKLAGFFAILAVFISCLGLFGMASFMAEQRIKEIGVRKVLGASIVNLWALLSKDFVTLVFVSLFIATPLAYNFMGSWLQNFQLHTDMPWWVFATTGASALIITLITVSYQSIKAALTNPVKSLKTE
jgi:ABC-type antimicrobial peptide transport system permease subunit